MADWKDVNMFVLLSGFVSALRWQQHYLKTSPICSWYVNTYPCSRCVRFLRVMSWLRWSIWSICTYTHLLTHKQVQNRARMLGILIADHLQNAMGKKKILCQKQVLEASSWERQGRACWHRGGICLVPRTPTICIFFISFLQSQNALSCVEMIWIWVLQLITSEIYLPMKRPNSSWVFFFFLLKWEQSVTCVTSAQSFSTQGDECAFRVV